MNQYNIQYLLNADKSMIYQIWW